MEIISLTPSFLTFRLSSRYENSDTGKQVPSKNQPAAQNAFQVTLASQGNDSGISKAVGQNHAPENIEESSVHNAGSTQDLIRKVSTKLEIRRQIEFNTQQLLRSYFESSPELRDSLQTYFKVNPEDLQAVANGKAPEYFNEENTTRRILSIFFNRYDGEDPKEFADRARTIIEQAYGEVESLVGQFPSIVQRTRELVLSALDSFANGEDVSDLIEVSVQPQSTGTDPVKEPDNA